MSDPSKDAQKKIIKYIDEKNELYDHIISFLDNSSDEEEDYFFQKYKEDDQEEFKHFVQLIASIANNYHRNETFLPKIFMIIDNYKDQIKQTFSNSDIFDIFKDNKLIILYMIEKNILEIDRNIFLQMESKIEKNGNRYLHFFYPELKEFLGEERTKEIEEELLSLDPKILDDFDLKRHKGENDSYISNLIRNDLVEDFVAFVTQSATQLDSRIRHSIFETNLFLIENNTTLIEYSAFYGSYQIFQFLQIENAKLNPSLWLYAIHSQNADLIHLLESLNIANAKTKEKYIEYLAESIKCHHKNFTRYITDTFLSQDDDVRNREEIISAIFQSHNYSLFRDNFIKKEFYYLCSNQYNKLVNFHMEKKEKEFNEKISRQINHNSFK
ncbi:hypothetical protein M9Y10_032302 [Tritrichomonas musculus]|uniref:DUF3447 domain-containing protein n=1 Tax=Tritrichomonas musculus TaxID=1915356 RepID=A0ABR2GZP3_9EUKA